MHNKVHFYFDMDGVLSVFDEQASLDKPFNIPGSHYFRTCMPDEDAIELFKTLNTRNNTMHVLTRIFYEIDDPVILKQIIDETVIDKREWLNEHVSPDVDYIALQQTGAKSVILDNIPSTERIFHVLIDDDPRILQDWVDHGGSGIQWLQPGRNINRWMRGLTIDAANRNELPFIIPQIS